VKIVDLLNIEVATLPSPTEKEGATFPFKGRNNILLPFMIPGKRFNRSTIRLSSLQGGENFSFAEREVVLFP
jgi:hypothetical protein